MLPVGESGRKRTQALCIFVLLANIYISDILLLQNRENCLISLLTIASVLIMVDNTKLRSNCIWQFESSLSVRCYWDYANRVYLKTQVFFLSVHLLVAVCSVHIMSPLLIVILTVLVVYKLYKFAYDKPPNTPPGKINL